MIYTSDLSGFASLLPSYPHLFVVAAYQTPEESDDYFRGDKGSLFEDVEEWLASVPMHRTLARHGDRSGYFWVALEDDIDAVHFKLKWADHLVS